MVTPTEVENFRIFMVTIVNPPICIFGCIANIFNMIIFTRKHMRSSTNIYLTALAFADFCYLSFALLELLNYNRFTHFNIAIYFYSYSTIIWLKEAFSYVSICITVGFTIERYIAVRYPIHRQRFCTEVNAKRLIIVVYLICILGTVTKSLEYKFEHKTKGYNAKTNTYCDEIIDCGKNHKIYEINNDTNSPMQQFICKNKDNITLAEFDKFELDNCKEIDYYKFLPTELRSNQLYTQIYSLVISIVFVVIPVIILILFNTLLIHIVRQASKIREKLTQVVIARSESRTSEKTNFKESIIISQENKITIVLISIVIVFLICQIPWAVYVILLYFTNIMEEQFSYVLAIIFNTLVDFNSAVNLILYCGLSEEYRTTSKKLLKSLTVSASSTIKQKTIVTPVNSTTTTFQNNA